MLYCFRGDHMRKHAVVAALIVTLFIPLLAYTIAEKVVLSQKETSAPAAATQAPPQESLPSILVQQEDGSVVSMALDSYVGRVLLAEMPASFQTEALKAQAVAIRTYTLKQGKHDKADVCTDSTCCQAYITPQAYMEKGGDTAMLARIDEAVRDTENQVLTYEGELIEATYFSSSGGRTEAAVAVWGADVPYLQSVESLGETDTGHFVETVTFSLAEFTDRLGLDVLPSAIGEITYTEGDGVDTIVIAGQTFRGTDIRKFLDLKSTAFIITIVGDTVTITTKGNGHRVGLSQYGAEAMAKAGRVYYEILEYYYPGTTLTVMEF